MAHSASLSLQEIQDSVLRIPIAGRAADGAVLRRLGERIHKRLRTCQDACSSAAEFALRPWMVYPMRAAAIRTTLRLKHKHTYRRAKPARQRNTSPRRTRREGVHLEHAHRAVPDDRLRPVSGESGSTDIRGLSILFLRLLGRSECF